MENEIHRIIEASASFAVSNEIFEALQKAKDAGKRERTLLKYCKDYSIAERSDITYSVWFNLALMYSKNQQYEESLHAYSFLLKLKRPDSQGYLRLNMGNVHYQQGNYLEAIKNYRMALDLISPSQKRLKSKICRNIGNSYVRMKDYGQAIQSLEAAINDVGDFRSALNLILCFCMVGDQEDVRNVVLKMLSFPVNPFGSTSDISDGNRSNPDDDADQRLLMAAFRILLSFSDSDDISTEYEWICEKLKSSKHDSLINRVIVDHASILLHERKYHDAESILKTAIKSTPNQDIASSNLSAVLFLRKEIVHATELAEIAIKTNRYNVNAIVNRGNCYFSVKDYETAKDMYLEAIGVKANCIEAIYNLGLVNLRMDILDEALRAFEKLLHFLPQNKEVYQNIAFIHEIMNNAEGLKWYNVLTSRIPNDPGVLRRLGEIYGSQGDTSQSVHYMIELCHRFPSDLDAIVWLGTWFVRKEMFEKSIYYFNIAAEIQPRETKWQIMVANCYRKLGDKTKAFTLLRHIHNIYPADVDCLRYLISICDELNESTIEYNRTLQKLQSANPLNRKSPITKQLSLSPTSNSDDSSASFTGADISEFLS